NGRTVPDIEEGVARRGPADPAVLGQGDAGARAPTNGEPHEYLQVRGYGQIFEQGRPDPRSIPILRREPYRPLCRPRRPGAEPQTIGPRPGACPRCGEGRGGRPDL